MEIIEWIKTLVTDYGAINVVIMFITIIITNLLKKPIVEHADEFTATAKKLTGLDVNKQVITSNIIYIPIGVSFVLYFVYTLFTLNFQFALIEWHTLLSNSLVYGMLSMTVYDIAKAKINAYIAKDDYKTAKIAIKEAEASAEGDLLVDETSSTDEN